MHDRCFSNYFKWVENSFSKNSRFASLHGRETLKEDKEVHNFAQHKGVFNYEKN